MFFNDAIRNCLFVLRYKTCIVRITEFSLFINHDDVIVYTQPTFHRRINVVWTLWINTEITSIWRWKWNKIWRQFFNVAQLWYNVDWEVETTLKQRCIMFKQHWNNVDTMLYQHCFNVASMLLKVYRNKSGCWIWICK